MDYSAYESCEHTDKALAPHYCPYRYEMGGEKDEHCTCCEECMHQCAMDI